MRERGAVLRRFLHHGGGATGLVVLVAVVAGSLLGRELWPYSHQEQVPGAASVPPSWRHPMGTSGVGNDVFAQVLEGTVRSVQVAVAVAVGATAVGTFVGLLAGYFRGWVDALLMRLVDLALCLPSLALLVVLTAHVSTRSWFPVALALAALLWMGCARLVRSVAITVREQEYVAAARALGASHRHVLARHILPASVPVAVTSAAVTASVAVLGETALSFLGFGVQPPDVSLGGLIDSAEPYTAPWQFYFPGLAVIVVVGSLHLVADGLREAFDPRVRGRRAGRRRQAARSGRRGRRSQTVDDGVIGVPTRT